MSESLPTKLYTCAQVQALDKEAIKLRDGDGFGLMQLAGRAAFELLRSRWPDQKRVTVFCGGGNNGGDGYIVAALAAQAGLETVVYYLLTPDHLSGDALKAFNLAKSEGVQPKLYEAAQSKLQGVIVDALLGIGIKGEVRDDYKYAINLINHSKLPILAIDTPSGICGDTGRVLGAAVCANATISYIGLKRGLLTAAASDYVGTMYYDSLEVEPSVYATQASECERLEFSAPLLAPRRANSHKGLFGRVLVLAGDHGFGGAGIMAAESALLSGAGIVSLATQAEHIAPALARRPELMVHATSKAADIKDLLVSSEVLVLGPGLGNSDWSKQLFAAALDSNKPMVVDADGLNLLAAEFKSEMRRDNWVLTPHPAEAARLLGLSTAEVQEDRFSAARIIQKIYGGTVVLKGAGTIIALQQRSTGQPGLALCSAGNPAMSTPGMGDVLAGVMGGLLAQGLALDKAAKLSVWAHATAGDNAARKQGRHLFATDLYGELRQLW